MKLFKKIYSWLHLWLGIVVGLVFSIASITGATLIFEDELYPLVYPEIYAGKVDPMPAKRLPLDSLYQRAASYHAGQPLYGLSIKQSLDGSAYIFRTEGERLERSLFRLDPETGALLGRLDGSRNFFYLMEELHRKLFAGNVGKAITGAACLAYLLILISGLLLWWPKNKKMLRTRLKIKWDAKAKRLNWDAHAVGGFYTLPILLLICLTGLVWSYKWYNQGLFYLFDGAPQQKVLAKFELPELTTDGLAWPIQHAFEQAQQRLPYPGDIEISLPDGKDENAIEISRENELAAIPNVVDRLFFDSRSGDFLKAEPYEEQTRGMKVRRFILPLHTGSFAGLTTKIIYFIAMLVAASLPFTGLFIYLGRKKKKTKKTAGSTDGASVVGNYRPKGRLRSV